MPEGAPTPTDAETGVDAETGADALAGSQSGADSQSGAPRPDGGARGNRNMDRWLGDGGMPLLASLGATLDAYGVDGESLGWVDGTFVPEPLGCNPHGAVQAGVHAVLFDACMNFAIHAALPRGDRARGTLELKTETMRPALAGERYTLRGEVTRLARQVAFADAVMRDGAGRVVSRATGTFLLDRANR